MGDERFDAIREALEAEATSLRKQLAEHGVTEEEGVEVTVDEGFADSAQATTERSELLALIAQLRRHLAEVVAARDRIDGGTYGKCESCGRTIPYERLEALPATRLCVTCKQSAG